MIHAFYYSIFNIEVEEEENNNNNNFSDYTTSFFLSNLFLTT